MGVQRALGLLGGRWRVGRTLRAVNRELDSMVARTPEQRDRYVDFLRVVAIGVVVLWHWCLSILYWNGDRWVMPNPISEVPGGWLATWPLQIVTVFFLVGGYANSAAWRAAQGGGGWRRAALPTHGSREGADDGGTRDRSLRGRRRHACGRRQRNGQGLSGYYAARMRRLLVPIAVFLAVWAAFEAVMHLVVPEYPGVLSYGRILFTPLWFIAAYVWVVLVTPLTACAHARARWLTLGGLALAVAAVDLGRFAAGVDALGWVNSALVWVLVHQLGYFYRDGTLTRLGWWGAAGLVSVAVLALLVLTTLDAYPRSMVATLGQERSNIFPTTVTIAVVAILQLGLIMLARAPVTRWLQRARAWKSVIAANSVILTVFIWHMTALLVVLAVLHAAAVTLRTEPTAAWWAERPFWLVAPLPVLAVLVMVFGRFEWAPARVLRSVGRMTRGGPPDPTS